MQYDVKSKYSTLQRNLDSRAKPSSSFLKHFPKYPSETLKETNGDTLPRNGTNPIKTNPWMTTYPRAGACQDGYKCTNTTPGHTMARSPSVDTSVILERSASFTVQPNKPRMLPGSTNTLPSKPKDLTKGPKTRPLKIIRERTPYTMNVRCESTCDLNSPHFIVNGWVSFLIFILW